MIADSNKQTPFINNALGPILDHFNNNGLAQHVYAIELFNEPEHMIVDNILMEGVPSRNKVQGSNKIPLQKVQEFATKVNNLVTSKGFKATIGSVSLKYSCSCGWGCYGNWWKDTGISFYSIHFYSWMAENNSKFDPYTTRPEDWCLDRPALVGESPDFTDNCVKG
jgi:hypothetical protein